MTLLKTKNEAKGGYIQKRTLGKGQRTNTNRQARQSLRGLLAIKTGGGTCDLDSQTGTALAKGKLTVSGLSSALKAEKRAELAQQLTRIADVLLDTELRIALATKAK